MVVPDELGAAGRVHGVDGSGSVGDAVQVEGEVGSGVPVLDHGDVVPAGVHDGSRRVVVGDILFDEVDLVVGADEEVPLVGLGSGLIDGLPDARHGALGPDRDGQTIRYV